MDGTFSKEAILKKKETITLVFNTHTKEQAHEDIILLVFPPPRSCLFLHLAHDRHLSPTKVTAGKERTRGRHETVDGRETPQKGSKR